MSAKKARDSPLDMSRDSQGPFRTPPRGNGSSEATFIQGLSAVHDAVHSTLNDMTASVGAVDAGHATQGTVDAVPVSGTPPSAMGGNPAGGTPPARRRVLDDEHMIERLKREMPVFSVRVLHLQWLVFCLGCGISYITCRV